MSDRELIDRLLFLAQTAVDQALDLNYDDPEDYFIYRELRELKAAVAALAAEPEPATEESSATQPADGNHFASVSNMVEPADGEVAELVKWLRVQTGGIGKRATYWRIADFLERLASLARWGRP